MKKVKQVVTSTNTILTICCNSCGCEFLVVLPFKGSHIYCRCCPNRVLVNELEEQSEVNSIL